MSIPTSLTYSLAALVAAHTALRNLLDAHVTLPGRLLIKDNAGSTLAALDLDDPSGTINGATGQFVIGINDGVAALSGTASYGEFVDGSGNVHIAMPCAIGSAPSTGFLVINSLTIVAGEPVQSVTAKVG